MRWQDVVDIFLITFILYRLYLWIQGTRALRILMALAGLGLLYVLARWSGLFITTWILQYLWAVILVITVVIFQSEIRQVLERMSPLRFFLGPAMYHHNPMAAENGLFHLGFQIGLAFLGVDDIHESAGDSAGQGSHAGGHERGH